MQQIVFRCPVRCVEVISGVRCDEASLERFSRQIFSIDCPLCNGEAHLVSLRRPHQVTKSGSTG
jgi:hypothetical protein